METILGTIFLVFLGVISIGFIVIIVLFYPGGIIDMCNKENNDNILN